VTDLTLIALEHPTEVRTFEKGRFEVYRVGPMAPRRLRPLIDRRDAHAPHERPRMLAPDPHALGLQQIAQHPTPREGQLEMQLIDPPHERELRRGHWRRRVVDRRPGEREEPRLPRDREPVRPVDHRFPLGPGLRPSALAKKSNSSACCPIFACSAFTSIAGSRRSPSEPKASAACATSWRRHSVIWFGWMSKRWASSASVALLSSAAKATFALNAGE